jgi:hypothetical protein
VLRAVNRGESYHQLRRTISYANYGKLRFGTEYEQHLWSECSRLIANCIIFYNATLLSKLLADKGEPRRHARGALVKQASPVAWQHVNLYGRYEFRKRQPGLFEDPDQVKERAGIKVPMVGNRLLKRSTEMPIAVIRAEIRYRNRNP